MSSEPAVRVEHLSKVYTLGRRGRTSSLASILVNRVRHPLHRREPREQFHALSDVTFDAQAGEVVGVIGKNGAGKSTLLKILSRITFPTEGSVEIIGRVGSLLEVGTGFHPELTGTENVYLNGAILGMSKREIDDRLEEIVDFAEVHKFLETPVKRYSSGMRVRLAFAVAAHLEPEVLIVDEVLSVGDAGFQAKCLDKMKQIASGDGRTVLYVTHNLSTLEHFCPRSLLLVGGHVHYDGVTSETVARYLRTFPQGSRGATVGEFDLASADRSDGGYQKVFQRLVLRPNGGAPSDVVRMGERLRMDIDVEGLDDMPDALIVVSIASSVNHQVLRMTSGMVALNAAHRRCPQESIALDIPSLALIPGDYRVNVQVQHKGENIDFIRSAGTFTVTAADLFGTGYTYRAGDGIVVLPWDWELRPAAVPEDD